MHFYSPAFLFSGKERSYWHAIKGINKPPATIQTISPLQAEYPRLNGPTVHSKAAAAARTHLTVSSAIALREIASEPICKKLQNAEKTR